MEEVKFYMDEHIHPGVTAGLRRRGVNVVTAQDVGMSSATDEEHLQFAVKEGRVILTQDEDFLRMHATGIPHCGIVFVPQHTPVGNIVRELTLLHGVLSAEDILNQVEYL